MYLDNEIIQKHLNVIVIKLSQHKLWLDNITIQTFCSFQFKDN